MQWDLDDLKRYDRWLDSPTGRFALAQEFKLFERLTSAWPRRGRSIVDIGCGPGVFLNFFHQAGFDVTGLDKSPVMLAAAKERLGHKAELHLGEASYLPFEDDSFDYALILTVLEFVPDPVAVLREARRVAKRAVLIGYLNRLSLYRLFKNQGLSTQGHWYFPWSMRFMVHSAIGPLPLHESSVLLGPARTWRADYVGSYLNKLILPLPLGGYCALVADLTTEPPLTPLPAWPTGVQPG